MIQYYNILNDGFSVLSLTLSLSLHSFRMVNSCGVYHMKTYQIANKIHFLKSKTHNNKIKIIQNDRRFKRNGMISNVGHFLQMERRGRQQIPCWISIIIALMMAGWLPVTGCLINACSSKSRLGRATPAFYVFIGACQIGAHLPKWFLFAAFVITAAIFLNKIDDTFAVCMFYLSFLHTFRLILAQIYAVCLIRFACILYCRCACASYC